VPRRGGAVDSRSRRPRAAGHAGGDVPPPEPHALRRSLGSPAAVLVLRGARLARERSLVPAACGGGAPPRAHGGGAPSGHPGLVLAPGSDRLPLLVPVQAERLPAPRSSRRGHPRLRAAPALGRRRSAVEGTPGL